LVYPFCAKTFQLGNTIGYFLNDLACANVSHVHFISVHKSFKILDPTQQQVSDDKIATFFDTIPEIIIHPNPIYNKNEIKLKMKKECSCVRYCWENNQAPWLKSTQLIHDILIPAIDKYILTANALTTGTILSNLTDLSSLGNFSTPLPLIPNVTIQYRCGDNIGFGKTRYGLLPFRAFSTKRIPESIRKYIYVIADSPKRQAYHAYVGRCEIILQRLFNYLKRTFPNSIVIIKRGGDMFLDYARIAYSNIVICSASTFCLWPAIANQIGTVYYPLTPLVAGAWDNKTAPFIKNNFNWIKDIEMIKEFKKYRPWTRLIDDLEKME
jgi:hypothetical protein